MPAGSQGPSLVTSDQVSYAVQRERLSGVELKKGPKASLCPWGRRGYSSPLAFFRRSRVSSIHWDVFIRWILSRVMMKAPPPNPSCRILEQVLA